MTDPKQTALDAFERMAQECFYDGHVDDYVAVRKALSAQPCDCDALVDMAYLEGAKAGWNAALDGDLKGTGNFEDRFSARIKALQAHRERGK